MNGSNTLLAVAVGLIVLWVATSVTGLVAGALPFLLLIAATVLLAIWSKGKLS